MSDTILLLPDPIANQIAAGEVIQRPASAVKELLENAVDAGATHIQLIIRDAGKELVQVIDNGSGMSEADARMAFARHATSKISRIEDLFHIRTMGFRGEALASMAAVAQVELKTRQGDQELGICLEIANSAVKSQEPCSCPEGTSMAMKNLFFNVPARRHFLKSNATEMRHIMDEFIHVSLGFPDISFVLNANGQELFHLSQGTRKQRLLQLLGQHYSTKLVTIQESMDFLQVQGFVGKPEAAKKTRGDQYFFVNNRYIRSGYLHHAVMNAFSDLLPADSYPLYALFIELDPTMVDINVHPTKQEIKFEDEKMLYAFIQSAVKHALARFSITPALDFELDPDIQQLPSITQPFTDKEKLETTQTGIFKSFTRQHQAHFLEGKSTGDWKELYAIQQRSSPLPTMPARSEEPNENTRVADSGGLWNETEDGKKGPFQIHGKYIVQQIRSGFILIDQQAAHERILYDRFVQSAAQKTALTQQSLFPQTITLGPADAALLNDLFEDLKTLGYDVRPFGQNTFVIQGVPSDMEAGSEAQTIEGLLEQFKHFSSDLRMDRREKMIRALARQQSVKPGKMLSSPEMQNLIDQLFACSQPQSTPSGKGTYLTFRMEELEKLFAK